MNELLNRRSMISYLFYDGKWIAITPSERGASNYHTNIKIFPTECRLTTHDVKQDEGEFFRRY